MFELLTYCVLAFMAVWYAQITARSTVAVLCLWYAAGAYFLAARFAPLDVDFLTYADALHMTDMQMWNPYYLKEWAYWITSAYVYRIVGDERLTFLIFDFAALAALFVARKRFALPLYFIPLALAMFPSVFGVQNVYRQFLGSIVLLLALSTERKKYRWPLFILAGFFHNSMLLFAPLMFVYGLPNQDRSPWSFLFIASSAVVVLVLPYAAGTKSSAATGANLAAVYVALPMLVLLGVLGLNRLKIKASYAGMYLSIVYMSGITLAGLVVLSPAGAERIGMICLFLMLPIFIFYSERHIKQSRVSGMALSLALAVPSLVFSSSRVMLMTAK